jgi:hypothetical protein
LLSFVELLVLTIGSIEMHYGIEGIKAWLLWKAHLQACIPTQTRDIKPTRFKLQTAYRISTCYLYYFWC